MSTASRRSAGTILIVEDHPAQPFEISVDDDYAMPAQKVVVRAGTLGEAADLLALYLAFSVMRQEIHHLRDATIAAESWSKLIDSYRFSFESAENDHGGCRIEIDGLILDPAGRWTPARPNHLPILQVN